MEQQWSQCCQHVGLVQQAKAMCPARRMSQICSQGPDEGTGMLRALGRCDLTEMRVQED